MKRPIVLACSLFVVACGAATTGDDTPVDEPRDDTPVGTSTAGAGEAADEPSASTDGVQATGGPVLTEVPDPCEYLTRADAEELLGRPTGPGRSYDAGGWNCVYEADSPRHRLVFDMNLGVASALYRNTSESCDDDPRLWVVTDAMFQGRARPEFERDTTAHIHFTVVLSPPLEDDPETLAILRGAAERALARLSR